MAFKDPNFVLPAEVSPEVSSPARDPPPMQGRKPSKSRDNGANAKPYQASVADADEESGESVVSANEAASTDGSAMDIDPTPPATQTNGTQCPEVVLTPASHAHDVLREQDRTQAQAQAQAPDQAQDRDCRLEFKESAPCASTPQEGLGDLNDLPHNPPLEARPGASHPLRSAEPAPLHLPKEPKAPELPQSLTMRAWREYLREVAAHIREFQKFDSQMFQHFAMRQHEAGAMGTPANVLDAMGDTRSGQLDSYMRSVKEHERARAHWNIGWQKHMDAMELFGVCMATVLKRSLPD